MIDDDTMSEIIAASGNAIDRVYLNGLPLTRFELFKFPNIETLTLSNLNLEYLDLAVNSTIREINIRNTVVPSIFWVSGSGSSLRKLTLFETPISSLLISNFLGVDYFSSINSNIDTLHLLGNQFVRVMGFTGSAINTIIIRNNKHVGLIFLSDNNIESIDLDTNNSIDHIHLTGNPLLSETITYLDGLTNLDVSY